MRGDHASARPQRILVYGVTGSGKSTAAQRIGRVSGHPVTLVDELAWLPGWVPLPEEEQLATIAEVVAGERWVLDSAYGAWLDVVLPRVDLVVGLDYRRWLSFGRLVRRTLSRMRHRTVVCNGNTETWGRVVQRDSILVWHVRSFARKRDRMRAWAAAGTPDVVLMRRPRDLERWLRAWEGTGDDAPESSP